MLSTQRSKPMLVAVAASLVFVAGASAASLKLSLPEKGVWTHPARIKASGTTASRATLQVWDLGKKAPCPANPDDLINANPSFPHLTRIPMPDEVGPGRFHVHDLYGPGPPRGKHRICGYLTSNSKPPAFGPAPPEAIASTVIRDVP